MAEIEAGTATVSCGRVLLSSFRSRPCPGTEGEIEVGAAAVYCGCDPLSPSGSGACAGLEDEIEVENNEQHDDTLTAINNVDESTSGESVHKEADANTALKTIRLKNRNGLLIAYLNINSIRNKIEFLRPIISETDILVIAETKIDDTFPTSQFMIEGFMKPSDMIEIRMGVVC